MASGSQGWNQRLHTPTKPTGAFRQEGIKQDFDPINQGGLKPPRSPYKSGPGAWKASGDKGNIPKDSYRVHPNKLFQDQNSAGVTNSIESKGFDAVTNSQGGGKRYPPASHGRKASPLMQTFDGSRDFTREDYSRAMPVSTPTQALVDSQDSQSRMKPNPYSANPQNSLRRTQSLPKNPLNQQFEERQQYNFPTQAPIPDLRERKGGYLHPGDMRSNQNQSRSGMMMQNQTQPPGSAGLNQQLQEPAQHQQFRQFQHEATTDAAAHHHQQQQVHPEQRFPNTYKTKLNDVESKPTVDILQSRALWSSVSRKMKNFRSRSYDNQKHIHRWPSFEPPVYILPGELLSDYILRIKKLKGEMVDENGISIPPEDYAEFEQTEQSIRTLPNHLGPIVITRNTMDEYRPSDRDSKALSATVAGLDFPSMMTSIPMIPNEDEPSGMTQSQSPRPTWQQESFAPLHPQLIQPRPHNMPQVDERNQPGAAPQNNQFGVEYWNRRNDDPLRGTPKFNDLSRQSAYASAVKQYQHPGLIPKSDAEDTNLAPPQPNTIPHKQPQAPPSFNNAFSNPPQTLQYKSQAKFDTGPIVITSAGQYSNNPMFVEGNRGIESRNLILVGLPRSRSATDISRSIQPFQQQAGNPIIFTPRIQALPPKPNYGFENQRPAIAKPELPMATLKPNSSSGKLTSTSAERSDNGGAIIIQSRPASPAPQHCTQIPPTASISQPQRNEQPRLMATAPPKSPVTLDGLQANPRRADASMQPITTETAAQQTETQKYQNHEPGHQKQQQQQSENSKNTTQPANDDQYHHYDVKGDQGSSGEEKVRELEGRNAQLLMQFMQLKALEPEFHRLKRAEQEFKGVVAKLEGRLAEAEGMNHRMETDFTERTKNSEIELVKHRDELKKLQLLLGAKENDINRLQAQEIDPSRLRVLEDEISRLKSFEREAADLRLLRSDILRLRIIENDYWRLKVVESELNRLKGIESAFESTRIRLSQAESELTRYQQLGQERLNVISEPLPPIPQMPTQDLPGSSPIIQAQLQTSAMITDMHGSLKEELSALGSLSTLILAKLTEMSAKQTEPTQASVSIQTTTTALEAHSVSQKILDTQRDIESKLKHIEDVVGQFGGSDGTASEGPRFDDPAKARIRIEKSLDGLKANELEDVRISNPELFARLQEHLADALNRNVASENKETQVDFNPSIFELEKMRTEVNKLVMERRRSGEDYHRLEAEFEELRKENKQKSDQSKILLQTIEELEIKLNIAQTQKAEAAFTGFDSTTNLNQQGAQTPALGIFNSGKGSDSNPVSDENKINDLIKYFSQIDSERGLKPSNLQVTPSPQEDFSSNPSAGNPSPVHYPTSFNLNIPDSAQRQPSKSPHTHPQDKQTPRTAITTDTYRTHSPATPQPSGSAGIQGDSPQLDEQPRTGMRRVQGSINPMLVGKTMVGALGDTRDTPVYEGVSPMFGKASLDRASFGAGFKGLFAAADYHDEDVDDRQKAREMQDVGKNTPTHSDDTYNPQIMSAQSAEEPGIQVVLAENLRDVVLPRFGIEGARRASEDLQKEDPSKNSTQNKQQLYSKFPRHSADALPNAAALLKLIAEKDKEIEEARQELQRLRELLHETGEKRQLEREALMEEETNQALRQSIKEIVEQLKSAPSPNSGIEVPAHTPPQAQMVTPPAEPTFFQTTRYKRDSITSSASSSLLKDLEDLPLSILKDRVSKLKKEREELSRKHKQLQELSTRSKSALLSRIGLIAESSMKFYETLKAANSVASD